MTRKTHLEAIEEFESEKCEFEKIVLKRALERNGNKIVTEAIELMDEEDKQILAKDMLNKMLAESPQLKKETEKKLLRQFEVMKLKNIKAIEEQTVNIEKRKEEHQANIKKFVKKKIDFIKEVNNTELIEADNSYDDITFFEASDQRKVVLTEMDKQNLVPQPLDQENLKKLIDNNEVSKKKLEELKDDVNKEKVLTWEKSLKLKFQREKIANLDQNSKNVAAYIIYILIRRVIEIISIQEDKIEYMKHFGDYLLDRKLRLDAIEHQKLRQAMAKLVFDDFCENTVLNMVKSIAIESYGLAVKVI